jgi:hypothetical protein
MTPDDVKWLLQRNGAEPGIWLLTIESLELGTAFLLARNTENVTSRGNIYSRAWFDLEEPNDTDEEPVVKLSIPNVDREVGLAVLETSSEILATFELVRPSDPDRVVQAYRGLILRRVIVNKIVVQGELSVTDHDTEPCFNVKIGPRDFPGLYL